MRGKNLEIRRFDFEHGTRVDYAISRTTSLTETECETLKEGMSRALSSPTGVHVRERGTGGYVEAAEYHRDDGEFYA